MKTEKATELFAEYLRQLRKTPADQKTEHTNRAALQALLEGFAADADKTVAVQHEPKRVAGKGAPDFKIAKSGMILGYVENKAIGEDLKKVLKSDQIAKYKTLSKNIVLTDYLEFVWINEDGVRHAMLCHDTDLESRKFHLSTERIEAVATLLAGFFSTPPLGIGKSQQLALALAARSKLLKDYLGEELVRQEREHQEGKLYGLYKTFRDQVFHELKLTEFADAFAQMLAYGLFLARLNADLNTKITLSNARDHVPGSFQLIHELVEFLTELNKKEYADVRWVVEEVLSIVNGLDLAAIHEDLSFRQRKAINRKVRAQDEEEHRLFERDPFIYFYEDYLNAYDKETRKSRGVYYTPPPVVNFIVRAIDDILKESFGIKNGLADSKKVTVLDFACGTGTFLLEVFERIFENIGGPNVGKADKIVSEHLLKNIYGFEYLIAPYTIAHLKLSQYLRDKGHSLGDGERLQVFLTNTLEPIEPQKTLLLPAVTDEVEAAQKVKDEKILVITGNPPYAGHSKNPSERTIKVEITERRTRSGVSILKRPKVVTRKIKTAIGELIERYKFVDGKPLGEQNSKWLQDDYVKFIRFAQDKMERAGEGVVGIITNHSYLDNPTFRGMRQSLASTFDRIWILDLHGSTKPKEPTPPDTENGNVFDIQKGVAIAIFEKNSKVERGILFSDVWGSRLQKYQYCADADLKKADWKPVNFRSPYYMFRPLDWTGWDDYEKAWQIADSLNNEGKRQIFDVNVLGFQTHRDHFAIGFTRNEIERRVHDMRDDTISDDQLRQKYDIEDNRDWHLKEARDTLKASQNLKERTIKCSFRPFDDRSCLFGHEFMDYPRRELLDSVLGQTNVQLLVSRQIGTSEWRHTFVADKVAESCAISDGSTEQNYCFPLYLFTAHSRDGVENLSRDFRTFVDTRYKHHYEPEEIFGYIYAVLYAPTYRSLYSEFLRIDFPRIPFPEVRKDFDILAKLGSQLVQAHLLKQYPDVGLAVYHGKGDHHVEAVRYSESEAEQAIWINKTQCFKPVPRNVWEFHIGGYQVLDKYLKSRKGRELSLEEMEHIPKVADSLAFTITQMEKIDAAYKKAFPGGG